MSEGGWESAAQHGANVLRVLEARRKAGLVGTSQPLDETPPAQPARSERPTEPPPAESAGVVEDNRPLHLRFPSLAEQQGGTKTGKPVNSPQRESRRRTPSRTLPSSSTNRIRVWTGEKIVEAKINLFGD